MSHMFIHAYNYLYRSGPLLVMKNKSETKHKPLAEFVDMDFI